MSGDELKHYVRISVYRFAPGTVDQVVRRAEQGLLPLFCRQRGFIAHQIIKTGEDEVVAVSTWDSPEGAARSVETALAWIEEHAGAHLVSVDTHFGEKVIDHTPFHEGAYDAAGHLQG